MNSSAVATSAKRQLTIFFGLLVVLSLLGYYLRHARLSNLAIVFVPALASVLARLFNREGFGDISLRWRGSNRDGSLFYALGLPLVICLLAYSITWLTGLADFTPEKIHSPLPLPTEPYSRFAATLLQTATVGLAFFIPLAAGEEIGWRGYMLLRLMRANIPHPFLGSGLIWATWHLPLILLGDYHAAAGSNLAWVALLFTLLATTFSFLLTKLRLLTGTIWAPILLHASWNAFSQIAFNGATSGATAYRWIGESGVILTAVTLLATYFFWQKSPKPGLLR